MIACFESADKTLVAVLVSAQATNRNGAAAAAGAVVSVAAAVGPAATVADAALVLHRAKNKTVARIPATVNKVKRVMHFFITEPHCCLSLKPRGCAGAARTGFSEIVVSGCGGTDGNGLRTPCGFGQQEEEKEKEKEKEDHSRASGICPRQIGGPTEAGGRDIES